MTRGVVYGLTHDTPRVSGEKILGAKNLFASVFSYPIGSTTQE